MKKTLLCSDCFKDEGLKLDAYQIGISDNKICLNCNSSSGKKLSLDLIEELVFRFFVQGTVFKSDYGAAPLIQYNEYHYKNTQVDFGELLNEDVKLFEKALQIGFFHYGPRLWTLGHIEPLKKLQSRTSRKEIIQRIITEFPTKYIDQEDTFYRIRKNPEFSENPGQYDSNPNPGDGRLDSKNFPILYGSQDLEVCIHECRVTVNDDLYIATLKPTSQLKLLDLTGSCNEKFKTEFESLDIAVAMLYSAGNHSYEISKSIAKSIFKNGFDGIIYPSFFSSLRTGSSGTVKNKFKEESEDHSHIIQNIALFGYPGKNGQIDHPIPVQIDHLFRLKLTTQFRSKLTT